jgi:hypothetical protein
MFVNIVFAFWLKRKKLSQKLLSNEDIYGENDIMRSNRHQFTEK